MIHAVRKLTGTWATRGTKTSTESKLSFFQGVNVHCIVLFQSNTHFSRLIPCGQPTYLYFFVPSSSALSSLLKLLLGLHTQMFLPIHSCCCYFCFWWYCCCIRTLTNANHKKKGGWSPYASQETSLTTHQIRTINQDVNNKAHWDHFCLDLPWQTRSNSKDSLLGIV